VALSRTDTNPLGFHTAWVGCCPYRSEQPRAFERLLDSVPAQEPWTCRPRTEKGGGPARRHTRTTAWLRPAPDL